METITFMLPRALPLWLLVLGVLLGTPGSALACKVCRIPKKSVADHLLEADAVVLARENPDRPFHLLHTEILAGTAAEGEPGLFIDSATRRLLREKPGHQVVVARLREGEKRVWKRIGIADDDFGPLARDILARRAEWATAGEDPGPSRRRFDYFAKLLNHTNAQVRTVAHLEVMRAPYAWIRELGVAIPRKKIRALLDDVRFVEWGSLYILMLAQSENPDDRAYIVRSFHLSERFGTLTHLGAWATAFVEVDGEKAIDFIQRRYLEHAGRKPEEVAEVLKALSVQGTSGNGKRRDRIVKGYSALVKSRPALATSVIPDLLAWKRWELTGSYETLLQEGKFTELQDIVRVHEYLARAKKAAQARPSSSSQRS